MVKSVIKEVIIMLLLCVAIILILGVLFYSYIPSNKIVPNKVAYTTPENVKQEITEDVSETAPVNITYQLTDRDINISKKTGEYKSGKQNPFESYSGSENVANGENTAGGTSSGQNTNTNTNSNTNSQGNSDGSYLPNTGTK